MRTMRLQFQELMVYESEEVINAPDRLFIGGTKVNELVQPRPANK